jgi:hypothetical protein
MGAIRLTSFGGIVPRTSERLIPDNAAQIAANCRLSSGELRPFNKPASVYTSGKTGPLLSMFRITNAGVESWMTWPDDVDVVKAPLAGTVKWCFTGDGEPRITTYAKATTGGGSSYPNEYFTLGVPKPITAPTVGHSGGVGAAVDRIYCYTFYSAWDEEGAVSPVSTLTTGKVDGTWAITNMDAAPPNSGTVTGAYASGETEFTDTVNHWLRVGEQVVVGGDTLTVTAVTSVKKFKVAGDYSAETAWARRAPWNTMTKRLYRTTGTTGTFELVAEGIATTSYNDTLTDAQIPGDELISTTWELPPVDLTGLFLLPSQALAGWSGNKLYVSEPNQPHAWPPEYAVEFDHDVVGAETFGSGVGVATESVPYIVSGVEPGQMSRRAWGEVLPCLSKRSVVSLGDAVLYASASGMVAISEAGVTIFTLPYFTEKEWPNYAPATMVSALAGRRLFVLYKDGTASRALIFNLLGDQYLTELHVDADELFADRLNGKLYLTYGSDVLEFDPAAGDPMFQDWQSKEIVLPAPKNLGAAKVVFEQTIDPAVQAARLAAIAAAEATNAAILATGNARGGYNARGYNTAQYNGSDFVGIPEAPPANEVTFMLYAGGKLRISRTVANDKPFGLPSGYKADTVSVRVISQCKINSIELGDTAKTLAQA